MPYWRGGDKVAKAGDTMTGKLNLPSSITGTAYFNLGGAGALPTTLVDGDVWLQTNIIQYRYAGITHSLINAASTQTIGGVKTFGNKPIMRASFTSEASINIPHGVAPTTPVNGDVWTTTAGLFIYINGVVKTVTLT